MKEIFEKESSFIRFDAAKSNHRAIFHSVQENLPIVDRSGNVDFFYGVDFQDLQKRARKLRKSGIEPDETLRAIHHSGRKSVNPNISN